MVHASGPGDKPSVNVELNIIPFIDLMSCLTAFLLFTAMWVNLARLEVRPAGRARDQPDCLDQECDAPKLSVLVDADEIWVGVSRINEFQKIPRTPAGQDWAALEAVLKQYKSSALFAGKTDIEIAAESTAARPVPYQVLIATMDLAIKAGFVDVGITEPQALSARPPL